MRRLLLALALVLAAADAGAQQTCTLVSGTWTTIGAGTALSNSGDADCTAPADANDTFNIASGVTVTVTPGATGVSFSGGTGSVDIDAGGTLVLTANTTDVSKLTLSRDTVVEGTITATGLLKRCVTDSATCVIAGQTAANLHTLSSWISYAHGTAPSAFFNIVHDGTWDSAALDTEEVMFFGDIDGSPANDSPAGRLRPFFNLNAITAGSDLITLTTATGNSTTPRGMTNRFSELAGSMAVNACAFPDTNSNGAVDDGTPEAADAGFDGSELDDTVFERERVGTIGSNPIPFCVAGAAGCGAVANDATEGASTLWTGMTLMLGSDSTDTPAYTIVDSADVATVDTVTIDPPLKSFDWTDAVQGCTVGWGWGTGTNFDTTGGLGSREFLTFIPAQIVASVADVELIFTGAGILVPTFAVLGPIDGSTGFGPLLRYRGTSTVDVVEQYTWHVNASSDEPGACTDSLTSGGSHAATECCNQSHIEIKNAGDHVFTNVMLSHDREDQDCANTAECLDGTCDGSVAGDDSAAVSGIHGLNWDGTTAGSSLTLDGFWAFQTGDDAVWVQDGDVNGGTFTWTRGGCGWIPGDSTNCLDARSTPAVTFNVSKLYVAGVGARMGECAGITTAGGSWCAADADCAGAAPNCQFGSDGNFVRDGAGTVPMTLQDIAAIAPDSDRPFFAGAASNASLSVDGAWLFDKRTNTVTSPEIIPQMGVQVYDMKHVSAPWATGIGSFEHAVEGNYFEHVRHQQTTSTGVLFMRGGTTLSVQNNVFRDVSEATNQLGFIIFNGSSQNTQLSFLNNVLDRSEVGTGNTEYMISALNLDGATESVATITGNVVAGYAQLLDCSGTVGVTQPIGVNLFAVNSGSANAGGQIIDGACGVGTDETAQKLSQRLTSRLGALLFGTSGKIGSTIVGTRALAGYRQNNWLTSVGITSAAAGGGSGGGSILYPPAIFPDAIEP